MDIKKELKEIISLIEQNKTVGHNDAGEDGTDMVALQDFEPTAEDSEGRVEAGWVDGVKYNGWYERLKQLAEIL